MKKLRTLLLGITLLSVVISAKAQEPTAEKVLSTATTQANKEHKQVFLIFHASWCGWCHHMDSLMTRTSLKPIFEKHFVITHITVLEHSADKKKDENPGGMEMLTKYGGANSGIPYWLIFGADGQYLANSRLKSSQESFTSNNGDNTGCPGTPDEVTYWTKTLEKVSHFSPSELAQIKTVFAKKND